MFIHIFLMFLCVSNFKGNCSSVYRVDAMQRHKRGAVFLFIALLVLNPWASVLVSADGSTGSVNVFAGGFSNVDVNLQGSTMNNTSGIDIPRNVTFNSASFLIEADAAETSPGSVWLDIDQDGSNEWAFTGTGYGNFAHQNTFNDSSTYNTFPTNGSNWSTSDPILLPHTASLYTADMNMSFSPQLNGGMLQLGHITDMVLGDVNNDTNEDVVLLSQLNNTTGVGTAISYVTWNATNGLTNTSWASTCDNATYSNIADMNNDGFDDVATFALADDLACIHLTNSTTGLPGPSSELNLYGGARDAGFADFNLDGFADIVSIHPNGTFVLRPYVNKSSAWGNNVTTTLYGDNSLTVANLSHLFLGSIRSGYNTSAVVIENDGDGFEVKWHNNQIYETINDLDDLGTNIVCGDIDNDGDMDFVSRRGNGGTKITRMRNSGSWDTDSSSRSANLINATIADHDGDGNNSLMMVTPGLPDGNASTIEGQIEYKDIYYRSGWGGGWRVTSSASHPNTYPWSNPQDIKLGDMDGDGLDEQIIIAGEGNITGLYISAWHTLELDINKDGITDLTAAGYAGDGTSGQEPLQIMDPFGEMYTILSPLMNVGGYTTDGYGISMSEYTFNFSANSTGTFNLSNLDFGYDFDFRVDINPQSSGNLTNIFNQRETGGVGIINVPLPFNSTLAGTIKLTTLAAEYQAGAPNLALPPTPIVTLDQLAPDRVVLTWQDTFDFGSDLIQFEIFRVANGTLIDLNSAYSTTPINISIDSEITQGSSYDYAVRSIHTYGVTSNLSTIVSVTIPYPTPPSTITGVTAQDTPNDGGGFLDIAWDAGDDTITEYKIYISSNNVTNVSSLNYSSYSGARTPDVVNVTLSCCSSESQLIDGTAYWVSVIGFDSLGNTTEEIQSYGPVYTRNDTLRSANLTWNISASSHQQEGHLDAAGPLNASLTLMAEGQPIEGEELWFMIEHPLYTHNFTGVTDENGLWQAVSVTQLSELSNVIFGMVGDVELSAGYSGSSDNILLQPIDNATLNQTMIAKVHTIVTASSTAQLNEDSSFATTINVDSQLLEQQFLLEGIQYGWIIETIDGDMVSSGEEEVKDGVIEISDFTMENTILKVWSLDTSSWLDSDNDNFNITFLSWVDDTVETNETDNGTENNTVSWQPTLIGSVVLNCPVQDYAWEQNATDTSLVCTLSNSNPFEVSVEILLGNQVAIEFGSSTNTYLIAANDSAVMTFTITRNGPSTGLFAGSMGVPWTMTTTATEWSLEATSSGEFNWNLDAEIMDIPIDNNNDNTTPTTTGSNTGLFLGIGAFIVLAIIGGAVVVLRPKDDDFDFEDVDWVEEEEIPDSRHQPKTVIPKTNKTLDELKAEGTTIGDDAPDSRPSSELFNEVDGDSEYQPEEVEAEHDEQSDDGITVDENGTEWYEDEVGVWWYREQGWQDWAEWRD